MPLLEIVAKGNKLSRASRAPSREMRRPIPVASTQLPVPYCYYHCASGHLTVDCQEKPPGACVGTVVAMTSHEVNQCNVSCAKGMSASWYYRSIAGHTRGEGPECHCFTCLCMIHRFIMTGSYLFPGDVLLDSFSSCSVIITKLCLPITFTDAPSLHFIKCGRIPLQDWSARQPFRLSLAEFFILCITLASSWWQRAN